MRGYQMSFEVEDYDLASTLNSGESFRWNRRGNGWAAVVHGRWARLEQKPGFIIVRTAVSQTNWVWLRDYLQVEVNIADVIATFPDDAPLRRAVDECHGLRLLRIEPWECLASFILSSTKQIVQIRQIVSLLCERYGERVAVPEGEPAAFAFPTAQRLAALTEADLRACKMGFRAPNLLATAREVAAGACDLEQLKTTPVEKARAQLVELPGVGPKIADCVLLYAYGFPTAFPMDVWVIRALRELYFRGRRVDVKRLRQFSEKHFGPNSGYAQQYLFHWIRTRWEKESSQ
jgi:N-glycosylase/DNA lyase